MTPPPMTTTRALEGKVAAPARPPLTESVIAGHVLQEQLEVGALELGDRTVVLLHGPGPEVVVQPADGRLDRSPQRPAVLRHQRPEPRASNAVAEQPTVVGLHQLLQVREVQVGLAPEVAE